MDASDLAVAQADARPIEEGLRYPSSTVSRSPFDRAVDACVAAGLGEAVLPVIPPNATVSEKFANSRGKTPGKRHSDGSWYGFREWTKYVPTPEDIALWRTWPGAGLGIRTDVLPALDIDVDDPELAKRIVALVRQRIGAGALMRTRAGSPRVAVLFRTDAPVFKRKIAFTLLGEARNQAVELLGTGQQVVIAGRHPSGAMNELDAPGLVGRTLDDIPVIDAAALEQLFDDLKGVISAGGGRQIQNERSNKARQANERLDPERALMRAVVARRQDWVPLLFNWGPGPDEQSWRISCGELCRDDILEEDLCIYPDGIHDFGTERSHTPISLIREFGDVGEDGEIGPGGAPQYGQRGKHPYAVVGELNPNVRRPTEAEAIAWLLVYLEGPAMPEGASRGTMLACLAAALGLNWQAMWAEHARTLALVPRDEAGNQLPEISPEEWTWAQIVENAPRITARRALDPKLIDRWCLAWEITGAATDDTELSALLANEAACARAYTPAISATPPPSIDAQPPENARSQGFELITGIIDAPSIPTRQHVIYPRCPCGELLLVVAEPGTSKSTLALFDALAIASGEERILRGEDRVSPERLHRLGPVIVYDAEDPSTR